MTKVIDFFKDVRIELAKVTWPTRNETMRATAIVVGVSLAFSIMLGALYVLFRFGIQSII